MKNEAKSYQFWTFNFCKSFQFLLSVLVGANMLPFTTMLSEVILQNDSTKLRLQIFCLLSVIFKKFLFSKFTFYSTKLASNEELTHKWKRFDVISLSSREHINRVLWLGVRMEGLSSCSTSVFLCTQYMTATILEDNIRAARIEELSTNKSVQNIEDVKI